MEEQFMKCLSDMCNISAEELKKMPPETLLQDLGITSITFLEFILLLEQEFNIEIYDSDLVLEKFKNIKQCMIMLQKYTQSYEKNIKKCLILDCDGVLWKGVSGEEPITIDASVLEFQSRLIELYQKGVLLCLCSKNAEVNIRKSFQNHKMILKQEYIAEAVYETHNKAESILKISNLLNLSTECVVCVDDSPYELGYINKVLPEVSTTLVDYKTPHFITQICQYFEHGYFSDLNRTKQYQEQKERAKEKQKAQTIQEYNETLQTIISVREANLQDLDRMAELSQRTRQFNLSDAHYQVSDLEEFLHSTEYLVLLLHAKDKYGDMGIVGMAVVKSLTIQAFMISCRVFDRGFENDLLKEIKQRVPQIRTGVCTPNGKNDKFFSFYTDNGISLNN